MASSTCLRAARNHSRGSYGQSPFARVGCWGSIAAMWYAFLSGRYSKKLRMLRSNQVMARYVKSPVVVSSDSTPQPISAIPFPAVTICNMNKASRKRARASSVGEYCSKVPCLIVETGTEVQGEAPRREAAVASRGPGMVFGVSPG